MQVADVTLTVGDGRAAGRAEWRRHWSLIPPCLVGIMLCTTHGYTLGVMIGPLEKEFGWTRAEISAGAGMLALISPFVIPLVGMLVDRIGPRRVALFGVVLYCAMLALVSTAGPGLVSWWLHWIAVGVASTFIVPLVWVTAINGAFSVNRGKALAITLCGTAVAAAVVPSLASFLVERQGWRQAFVSLAAIMAVVVFPLVFFLFRGARDVQRGVERGGGRPLAPFSGLALREGLRSHAFRNLTGGIFIFSLASCTLTTNGVPILISQGFERMAAAQIAGLIGLGGIVGRLCGGFLLDRFDAKKVAAASVLTPVLTLIIYVALPGHTVPVMIGTLILGVSAGTEIDACAYLAARHFGMRSFGALFGVINGTLALANGAAPVVSNYVYDVTKSYAPVLWALIPLCFVASFLLMRLKTYPVHGEEAA